MNVAQVATRAIGAARSRGVQRLRFGGEFVLDDRRQGSERLLVVIAGFKDHLWPFTLARLERHVPAGTDVCVVSAGLRRPDLAELCARTGWSYLSTENRRVSAAQNIAIREHPAARWIAKVDEDVLVGAGCFEALHEGFARIQGEGEWDPGFVAPVLNVNGFSYTIFLERLGLLEEFRATFGGTPHASMGIPVQADGAAAQWIWRRSVPFDEVVARFAAEPPGQALVPHRFSIGLILLRRELWEDFGGFSAPLEPPGLGADESFLCQQCVEKSKVMVVLTNVVAGHIAFGPQEAAMREVLPELAPGLVPA